MFWAMKQQFLLVYLCTQLADIGKPFSLSFAALAVARVATGTAIKKGKIKEDEYLTPL